jgi:hypothetical protein
VKQGKRKRLRRMALEGGPLPSPSGQEWRKIVWQSALLPVYNFSLMARGHGFFLENRSPGSDRPTPPLPRISMGFLSSPSRSSQKVPRMRAQPAWLAWLRRTVATRGASWSSDVARIDGCLSERSPCCRVLNLRGFAPLLGTGSPARNVEGPGPVGRGRGRESRSRLRWPDASVRLGFGFFGRAPARGSTDAFRCGICLPYVLN